jgi:glutathione S-transferase
MLILYHGWLSSASRRVRLCLAEKGLAYESRIVDVPNGEQHSPEYLAINPNGVVPALLHGKRVLYESSVIAEYLDETFTEQPIRPADPYARAVMRNFVRWIDDACLSKLIVFNWSISMESIASRWTDEELEQRLARIPSASRREAWIRVARKPYTDDEKAEAMRGLLALLDRMDGLLQSSEGRWLIADACSIADFAAAPFVMRISELNPEGLSSRPRVAEWWSRIQARPCFAQARIGPYVDSPPP